MIEVGGLMALGILYWITFSALNGPQRLPDRIPTHFDISGQPNGWGSPNVLWLLPVIGSGLYLMMTALGSIEFRRYNLPVRVTDANLGFVRHQTREIVVWIKCEVLCLFVYLQRSIIESAKTGRSGISPLTIPVFLALIFLTVGWQLTVLIRGAQERAK
jgi:uncharacterized membrane protein